MGVCLDKGYLGGISKEELLMGSGHKMEIQVISVGARVSGSRRIGIGKVEDKDMTIIIYWTG